MQFNKSLIIILVPVALISIFVIIGYHLISSEGKYDAPGTETQVEAALLAIETIPGTPNTITKEVIDQSITNVVPVASGARNIILYLVISVLSFSTLLSIAITFYLYKWRRILLSNPNMVVPEEWAKYLQNVGKSMERFNKTIAGNLRQVLNATKNNTEKISGMTETYMELQSILDEKDAEIKRFKNGYDAEIFRRFIYRFARVEHTLDDLIREVGKKEYLLHLKKLFADAFEECGVSLYEPAIGEDYRKAGGVSDNPKTAFTKDPNKEFLISEILASGYQLNAGMSKEVIIPAKVRIYKLG